MLRVGFAPCRAALLGLATVDCDKEKLLLAMPLIREHLWQTAEVRVNPKKYYLQHYKKGVKFSRQAENSPRAAR